MQGITRGNCKTTLMIACSPAVYNANETISTLRFGVNPYSFFFFLNDYF